MRILVLAFFILTVPMLCMPALAQDNVPRKSFDPVETPTVKPLNLKSILRGKSSGKSKSSKRNGPTSRNTMELLKAGEELPFTRALAETADYNEARDIMRRTNSFEVLDDPVMIEAKLNQVREQEQANIQAQWERRNKFYIAHNIADEHTREYLRTKQGRLFKREFRKEQRADERAAEAKAELASQKQKAQAENVYKPFNGDEKESSNKGGVVVPTAKPSKDGQIKPFFYR